HKTFYKSNQLILKTKGGTSSPWDKLRQERKCWLMLLILQISNNVQAAKCSIRVMFYCFMLPIYVRYEMNNNDNLVKNKIKNVTFGYKHKPGSLSDVIEMLWGLCK
uniref:Uncharacterized protein n=1 Tax=Seriola lalandi dorsalis TaxID=1841481 RepID=A0A3B4XVU4_SERLL